MITTGLVSIITICEFVSAFYNLDNMIFMSSICCKPPIPTHAPQLHDLKNIYMMKYCLYDLQNGKFTKNFHAYSTDWCWYHYIDSLCFLSRLVSTVYFRIYWPILQPTELKTGFTWLNAFRVMLLQVSITHCVRI